MKPVSAKALVSFSALVLLVGMMIGTPSGGFVACGLAALLTLFPCVLGTGRPRLVALVMLVFSGTLAANKFMYFRAEQQRLGTTAPPVAQAIQPTSPRVTPPQQSSRITTTPP